LLADPVLVAAVWDQVSYRLGELALLIDLDIADPMVTNRAGWRSEGQL
jgi:hypothetical protein